MIKILLGGSPCTYWSIAQKNGRETTASGMGWELFKNYLIAKEKYKPDYFLYENNKSASQPIKDQIKHELEVCEDGQLNLFTEDNGVRFTYINSALVSAQNRQRFYVTNFGDIKQPEDRGILLRDVIDYGINYDKSLSEQGMDYMVRDSLGNYSDRWTFLQRPDQDEKSKCIVSRMSTIPYNVCAEPVRIPQYQNEDKARPICSGYANKGSGEGSLVSQAFPDNPSKQVFDYVAEPVPINTYNDDGKKSRTLMSGCYKYGNATIITNKGFKGGTTAVAEKLSDECYKGGHDTNVIGMTEDGEGKYRNGKQPSQQYRVYSCDDKSPTIPTCSGGNLQPKVMQPVGVGYRGRMQDGKWVKQYEAREDDKSNSLTTARTDSMVAEPKKNSQPNIYEVKDGQITIKGKQYPIKLKDRFYIIRKLSVDECRKLQTIPDWYVFPVSKTQAYKMIGNGWTIEVIKHLLSHIPNIYNEEIEVLSMYDGMSCGQIALKEMGCNVVRYYATEIDKYAIKTTQENFPNTIQLGDAFQVREEGWCI